MSCSNSAHIDVLAHCHSSCVICSTSMSIYSNHLLLCFIPWLCCCVNFELDSRYSFVMEKDEMHQVYVAW